MRILIIIIALIISSISFSQEVLVPMSKNPALVKKELFKETKDTKASNALELPFIDDFSYKYKYPLEEKWQDNNVIINKTYGVNPVTMGVATFDAINDTGGVISSVDQFPSIADVLTSNSIRMDTFFGAVPVALKPSDSVYLSFYIQPQGLGNAPEEFDSLVLQFYDKNADEWNSVWNHKGMELDSFKTKYQSDFLHVFIPILDNKYYNDDFRFRFYNYASIPNTTILSWRSGMYDHWNLDYVYINRNRSMNDTGINDIGIQNNLNSLLKDYVSIPWNQYQQSSANLINDTTFIRYINLDDNPNQKNVNQYFSIQDLFDNTVFEATPFPSTINMNPGEVIVYSPPYSNYQFQSNAPQYADFEVKYRILTNSPPPDITKYNDTLRFYQRFYNYYAYDDGIPEAGYGLSSANAKLAYKFTLSQADSLQSVQMFFNQTLANASQQYFYLTIWDDNNGVPGNVIYEQSGLRPEFENKLFKYHTYVLDEAQYLSGTFYIGWRQTTTDNLNIGFDYSNDQSDKIFYNAASSWQNTSYKGSLMIRPIFGNSDKAYVGIDETTSNTNQITLYPNPANSENFINFKAKDKGEYELFIFDIRGNLLKSEKSEGIINISNLEAGVYFVKFVKNKQQLITKKLIIID